MKRIKLKLAVAKNNDERRVMGPTTWIRSDDMNILEERHNLFSNYGSELTYDQYQTRPKLVPQSRTPI